MPTALLDVNVLLSLAWPQHEFHVAARRWYDAWAPNPWATCPLTQLAFIRLSSNPQVIPDAVSPKEAADMLDRYIGVPQHAFWQDSIGCTDRRLHWAGVKGHKQVTDAYLLGLATVQGEKLATFDRAMAAIAGGASPAEQVILIPR